MINASRAFLALQSETSDSGSTWVHVLPHGTFSGRDGRGPYSVDNASSVVEATRAYFGKVQIVVDYEHQSEHANENGRPAPAAGWITALQVRGDGIWAQVDWTEAAAAHIAKREYRYLSPVFYHRKDGLVTALKSVALTNGPNLDQLIALNRAENTMDTENLKSKLAAFARLLGLPETAGQAEILAKFNELSALASDIASLTGDQSFAAQAANPDPAKFVPIGDFERAVADANKLRQGVTESVAINRVEQDVRSGQLAPFLKDWAVSLCKVNLPAYDGFMGRVGPAFAKMTADTRLGAYPPAGGKADALSDDEQVVASRMGLTAEEYAKAR